MNINVISSVDVSDLGTTFTDLFFFRHYLYLQVLSAKVIVKFDYKFNIIKSFDISGINDNPQGICTNGYAIFSSKFGSTSLYMLSSTCSFISTFTLPVSCTDPRCIDFANNLFYLINGSNKKLFILNNSFSIIRTIALASLSTGVRGIVRVGNYFYFTDQTDDKIYKCDLNGNIIDSGSIADIELTSFGICFDGMFFYMIGNTNKTIYKLRLN